MMFSEALFWVSLAVLAYIYGGFVLLVLACGGVLRRGVRRAPVCPRLSLVIAAYNEERNIARKLDNALGLDYPPEALEILVASDGSTDATVAIARTYEARGVRVLDLPRRGKVHALDACIAVASGEVLVLSDANTMLDAQALRMLARNFADPAVGGVCGNQLHRGGATADSSGAGERLYWRYDRWVKRLETRTGSIVAADGALYAIRRSLYRKPEHGAVTDDFAISTAVIEQGYRLVFDADAIASEAATGVAAREFNRKVRIMVRGLRGVWLRRRLLNPRRSGFYAVILLTHKVLRRLAIVFLGSLFVASCLLASQHAAYRVVLGLQVGFYALAFLGYLLRSRPLGHAKVLYAPFYYCLANVAAAVAVVQLLRGTRIEQWQPQRSESG